ncbi:hypothetical protein HDU76_012116, partial [Blyttiomyces sp. JEL0837]
MINNISKSIIFRAGAGLSQTATTSTATATAAIVSRTAVAGLSTIRDAGGAFSKKEAAQEDKFIHDHDAE